MFIEFLGSQFLLREPFHQYLGFMFGIQDFQSCQMSIIKQDNFQSPRTEQLSKVLLVCVYDTVVLQITEEAVLAKFQSYGEIITILVFARGKITKLFVEFATVPQAVEAKAALDGAKLFQTICKMNIYFSNFHNVDLRREAEEAHVGVDDFADRYEILSRTSELESLNFIDDETIMSAFTPLPRSKTEQPYVLNQYCFSSLDSLVLTQHNGLLSCEKRKSKDKSSCISEHSKESPLRLLDTLKIKDELSVQSNAITFSSHLNLQQAINLLSNYGNISFISKVEGEIYVKFRDRQYAVVAWHFLYGFTYKNKPLQFKSASNTQTGYPREGQYGEMIFFPKESDRQKVLYFSLILSDKIAIYPPSSTILVRGQQGVSLSTVKKLFGKYGEIEQISMDSGVVKVSLSSVDDGVSVMCGLQGHCFEGGRLELRFEKMQEEGIR